MADAEQDARAEQEQVEQNIKEKEAREARIRVPLVWPHDEQGRPMAIVTGQASDLTRTGPFSNVNIGPSAIMRPVPNHEDPAKLVHEMRLVQLMAEFVVGTERRLVQWAQEPSAKIELPASLIDADGNSFEQFVAKRLGLSVAPRPDQG